jgi:hypothetical protein
MEYPSKQELDKIKNWSCLTYNDGVSLAEYIVSLWNWSEYGPLKGKRVKTLTLRTGGWSGNEDIIDALNHNFMFTSLFWQKSERGGLHIYKIKPF